jgi:hypothetical protein
MRGSLINNARDFFVYWGLISNFMLAKQALYHLSHASQAVFSGCFENGDLPSS